MEVIIKERKGVRLTKKPNDELDVSDAYIDIDLIVPKPDDIYLGDDFYKDVGEYVKANGLPMPIYVYPKGDFFELSASQSWFYGARFAGLKEVPVIIQETVNQVDE